MRPYYQEPGITIYCGDCREFVPSLQVETIITDPVWPNSSPHLIGAGRPQALLEECLKVASADRLVLHLGCSSDPRFMAAVPSRWPFLRVCWLEYACPSYRGRILNGSDVAYVFGEPPAARKGAMVLPGRTIATNRSDGPGFRRRVGRNKNLQMDEEGRQVRDSGLLIDHPAPRRLEHLRWLVKWFAGGSVLDPFGGSGTTAVACKAAGVSCTLIEIEERFCEIAAKRLCQGVLDLKECHA